MSELIPLHEHRIVNVRAECFFYRAEVRPMAVCGQLRSMRETFGQVFDERHCCVSIAS